MSRGDYGLGKRQRENDKARKKREKARRRAENRARGASEPEYVSAEAITDHLPSIDEALAAMDRGPAQRRSKSIPMKLFIGSLSRSTTSDTLRETFEQIGPVEEAIVIMDRTTGDSRGFGFVTMESRRDGSKSIEELDGLELDGRNIVVKQATER